MSEQDNTSPAPLLEALIAEQRRTNQLLAMLIEVLAEDSGTEEEEVTLRYMDGTEIEVPSRS